MTLPIYITGTVSVTHLGTTVTGNGVMWSGINAREGDFFVRADGTSVITEVTDQTTLQITPWPGATIAGGNYAIEQNYVGRVVGVAAAEDVGVMLEKLHTSGLPFIVGLDETVPDPSYGDDGQFAFKPDTGEWWVKQGGVWVPSSGLAASVRVSDTAPAGASDNSLWWDSANGILYIRYNDGNSTQWVAATQPAPSGPAGPTGATGQAGPKGDTGAQGPPGTNGTGTGDMVAANNLSELTATAPTARKNIYAAPFDAMAYSGMQINGGFDVSQQFGSSGTSVNGQYPADGWMASHTGSMTVNMMAFASAIEGGIPNFLGVQVGTTQASPGAGDSLFVQQGIEGYRAQRLGWGGGNAAPVTLVFWSQHAVAGLYSGAIRNNAANRCYVFTYTQASANVAQYNVITIPGDTAGAWAMGNVAGLYLDFTFACGATLTAPSANNWLAGNFIAAPGQVNAAAVADWCRIAGVMLLPGNEAPSAARLPLVMRPYDTELRLCERYYQLITVGCIGAYFSAAVQVLYTSSPFRTEMRAAPTGAVVTAPTTSNCAVTINTTSTRDVRLDLTSNAAGQAYSLGGVYSLAARL